MVSTKHCCHGECKTDSRYPEHWPKSLLELEESGKKVFIPFPKPSQDVEKCRRWISGLLAGILQGKECFEEYLHLCSALSVKRKEMKIGLRDSHSRVFSLVQL